MVRLTEDCRVYRVSAGFILFVPRPLTLVCHTEGRRVHDQKGPYALRDTLWPYDQKGPYALRDSL